MSDVILLVIDPKGPPDAPPYPITCNREAISLAGLITRCASDAVP
jgi:hypothetical protein